MGTVIHARVRILCHLQQISTAFAERTHQVIRQRCGLPPIELWGGHDLLQLLLCRLHLRCTQAIPAAAAAPPSLACWTPFAGIDSRQQQTQGWQRRK